MSAFVSVLLSAVALPVFLSCLTHSCGLVLLPVFGSHSLLALPTLPSLTHSATPNIHGLLSCDVGYA